MQHSYYSPQPQEPLSLILNLQLEIIVSHVFKYLITYLYFCQDLNVKNELCC